MKLEVHLFMIQKEELVTQGMHMMLHMHKIEQEGIHLKVKKEQLRQRLYLNKESIMLM